MTTVGKIAAYVEELAPPEWAEQWDNVGLQVGEPGAPANRILVALELTGAVIEEAVQTRADLVVVHHPAIFRPLKALRFDTPTGGRIRELVRNEISLYAAHTNLDQAKGMTNDSLAAAAGLSSSSVIERVGEEKYLKLVVFVSKGDEAPVMEALTREGAGHIGQYSHCTFQTSGTGTFLPLEGTSPYIGKVGQLERVDEIRLETIIPESKARQAVQAMIAAHPYEEVAYDLYPLANPGQVRGHGRIGLLSQPVTVAELVERLKAALQTPSLRIVGDPDRLVATVAVGAGSGSSLIGQAARRGADVLITGDIGYHNAQDALDLGLALIDVGHYNSEAIVVPPLVRYLRERLAADGLTAEVIEAQAGRDPFTFL